MAQDNPFARYRPQPAEGVIIRDPTRDAEERRAEAELELERERLRVSQQNAVTSAQNAAVTAQNANRPPAGYRWAADGSLEVIPGGPADPQANTPQAGGKIDERTMKLGQLRTLLDQIDRVEELYRQNLEGGLPNGISGRVPGLIRPENEQFASAAAGMAEQGLAAFRVPGVGSQSDNELRQFVEANRPLPTDSDLAIQEKLRQLRNRANTTLEAWGFDPAELSQPQASSASTQNRGAAGAGATETSVELPPEMQAEHSAYLAQNWGRLDPQAYAQYRAELDRKYGFEGDPAAYQASAETFNTLAGQGVTPGMIPAIPAVNVPLDGLDQARNDFVTSAPGAFLASMGNAGGLGIPSLMAGEQMDLAREESPGWSMLGEIAGGITGTIGAGKLLGIGAEAIGGGRSAAMLANPLTSDIVYGGGYGATQADDPLYGAAGGVAGALLGDVVGKQIGRRLPFGRPENPLSRGEQRVAAALAEGDPDAVNASLQQAFDLNVPATLADVSPELNSLTGAALRRSPSASGVARELLGRRNRSQIDRFNSAIERDLGPVENIPQRSEDLITQARAQAGPLYESAYAAPGVQDLDLSDIIGRPSMSRALANARRIALEEGRNPDSMGFVVNDAGEVALNSGASTGLVGRPPSSGLAPANIGADGNIYVGDPGTSHFGVTEKFPQIDFTGDTGFVTPDGIYLNRQDALKWANANGPEIIPSENMFGQLDALDYRDQMRRAGANIPEPARQPTWQTMDYVKRGLDDVLEGYRDRTTGRLVLDTEGRAVNDTLREFLSRVDAANPDYAAARAAYAGPASERTAMQRGMEAVTMSPDQLAVNIRGASPSQVDQMRLGFQSRLSGNAERLRNNSNPFGQLDNPAMEQRLGTMYEPDSVARLLAQRDLEGQLAASSNRLIGNSATAERAVADAAFDRDSMTGDILQGVMETAVTGAPVATALRSGMGRGLGQVIRDRRALGFGRNAQQMADEIAAITLQDDPQAALQVIDSLMQRGASYEEAVQAVAQRNGNIGGNAGAGVAAVLNAQAQR